MADTGKIFRSSADLLPPSRDMAASSVAENSKDTPEEESFEDAPDPEGVSESEPTPAKPPKPGIYTAKGDPYTYRVDPDGGVTIMEGPTGVGHKIKDPEHLRIFFGQIASGTLKPEGKGMPGLAPDRPGMNSHLDAALDEAAKPKSLRETTSDVVAKNME